MKSKLYTEIDYNQDSNEFEGCVFFTNVSGGFYHEESLSEKITSKSKKELIVLLEAFSQNLGEEYLKSIRVPIDRTTSATAAHKNMPSLKYSDTNESRIVTT